MAEKFKEKSAEQIRREMYELIAKGEDVPAEKVLSISAIYAVQIMYDCWKTIKADNFLWCTIKMPDDNFQQEYEIIFRKKKRGLLQYLLRKLKIF